MALAPVPWLWRSSTSAEARSGLVPSMDSIPAVQAASQATNGSSDGSERGIRHRSYRIFKTERESLRWPHHRHAAGAACPPRSFLADTAEHRQWQTPGAKCKFCVRQSVCCEKLSWSVCKWCRLHPVMIIPYSQSDMRILCGAPRQRHPRCGVTHVGAAHRIGLN